MPAALWCAELCCASLCCAIIAFTFLTGSPCTQAKTTFMVLPCTGISDMTDQEVVHKAVQHVLAQGAQRDFGVQALEVDVTSMAVYTYRTCTKEVLKVHVPALATSAVSERALLTSFWLLRAAVSSIWATNGSQVAP